MGLKARVLLYEGRMDEAISVCEMLMNDPATYGSYALESNYTALFSDATVNNSTSESMYSLQYVPSLRTWGEYIDFAPITAGARTNNLAPTQELVDSYIMLNGKAIDEAGSGYDIDDPYTNRDPRLKETIVYDQYEWKNPDGSTQTIYIEPGTAPAGQTSNEYSNAGQGTATGYYWRKYWDPNYAAPGISSGLNLHIIRWAEILLDYAEAKNAKGEMTEDVWNKTIRLIRQRAGFTDAGALDYPSGSSRNMTDIIRNERRSEFVLEDKRIDDIRRWKIAENVMNGWAHGARYGDAGIDNGYLRVQQRTFDPGRHYLWPVPPAEIALNSQLTQNTGY